VKSEKIWHCIWHEARDTGHAACSMQHEAGNKQPGNCRSRIIQNMQGAAAKTATSAGNSRATEVVIYSLFTLE